MRALAVLITAAGVCLAGAVIVQAVSLIVSAVNAP